MSDEYSVTTNFQRGAITAEDYEYKMARLRAQEDEDERRELCELDIAARILLPIGAMKPGSVRRLHELQAQRVPGPTDTPVAPEKSGPHEA